MDFLAYQIAQFQRWGQGRKLEYGRRGRQFGESTMQSAALVGTQSGNLYCREVVSNQPVSFGMMVEA